MKKQEQAAIEAVARLFSAAQGAAKRSDPTVTIAGSRVALAIATLKPVVADGATPRLRSDKVVQRLVRDVRAGATQSVPDGSAVIVTVTAPIRQPGKTAAALESAIRACLARRSAKPDIKDTLYGNEIRIRRIAGAPRGAPKIIGFVHNPDTDGGIVLDLAQSLLRGIAAAMKKPARAKAARWLVLVIEDGIAHAPAYRQVCAALSPHSAFAKVLMVFPGGRTETVTE